MASPISTKKPRQQHTKRQPRAPFLVRHHRLVMWLLAIINTVAIAALAVWAVFQLTPWPNAMLIRDAFDKNNARISSQLQKYVPSSITQIENQQYSPGDKDAKIDVFYPSGAAKPLKTIVWVHGGAWVAGNKDDIDNYMRILAGRGFTTVSVNYSIAPEKQYPTPLLQLNEALSYIQQEAPWLHVDDSQIFLAGDSAGSQIVAQMSNMITSKEYATEVGIAPTLSADRLKGVLLNCGAYDLALPNYSGPFGNLLHTVLWAYSGKRDFLHDDKLRTASVVNFVTPKFPPAFITAGNVDPLLEQSTEFAKKLKSLSVPTYTLFYPEDHQPQLSHEYQFELDSDDAKKALGQMIDFVNQH